MQNNVIVFQGEVLDETVYHTVDQLCQYAMINLNELMEMVEEGIVEPTGNKPEQWVFNYRDFTRSRLVSHLQHDLGVNLAGAAIIINLLEQ